MTQTVIFILLIVGVLGMVFSGTWFLLETFLLFRIQMTESLNASLDIIKVIKNRRKDNQGSGGKGQTEKEEIAVMEHLLYTLSDIHIKKGLWHNIFYGKPQIVFEIAVPSDGDQISFYVSVPCKIRELVEKQIHSFYPSAHIEQVNDYTIFRPKNFTAGSYLKLKKNFSFPIRTYQRLESDPLASITNALSKMENEQEGAAIQYIIRRSSKASRKGKEIAQQMQQGKRLEKISSGNLLGEVVKDVGKNMFDVISKNPKEKDFSKNNSEERPVNLTPEENDIIKQIETKANKARFEVNIRLLASAQTKERAEEILAQLENSFTQFEDNNLNKFVAIRSAQKNAKKIAFNFIFRNFNANESIILDTEELASVFHFPISTTETPKINWLKSKAAPPPSNIPKEGLLIGYSDFRGTNTKIRIGENDRRRHLYIVGQTGVGKSGFIEEMAKQDAKNKKGMCVIDPHGDLIDHILECVPKERARDIIYFDPADTERPFGLNMLEYDYSKPEQRTFVINEMIAIFDKLYDLKQTGGPMFEQYMRNAMLLVLDSPELGATLMEIPRVLRDPDFRMQKLKRCRDVTVVEFWKKEAEKAGGEAALENIAPYITSKLTTFISNDMMRPIIAQQRSTINFREVMDESKLLLINLSKGKIGEINSHLLGMVIVGKLLMAALSRTDIPEEKRRDFYLYIDEFQNFTTDSISQILSEARKYRLCMTIAHQFIGQLSENVSKAVFGNVGSICSFRVGAEDAEFLQKQFSPVFDAEDLINIDNFNCITKLLINNEATGAFNMKTFPPRKGDAGLRDDYKELSRYEYGRSREDVEDEINKRYEALKEVVDEI
jgi:hypothetical protein